MSETAGESVRIDRWLWAARWFKTRSAAATACTAGHVKLNGESAKPAKSVRVGDQLELRVGSRTRILEVTALSLRRGPADVARTLYVDHSPPPPPQAERLPVVERARGTGRPSKRDLRKIQKLRGY